MQEFIDVNEVLGDPDQPHAYSYTSDPVAWRGTTRGLIERFAAAAGSTATVRTLPTWMLRLVGVFSPEVRGVPEMIYQFEIPYALDDSRFRRTFAVEPTPIDVAVAATLAAHEVPTASRSTASSPPIARHSAHT